MPRTEKFTAREIFARACGLLSGSEADMADLAAFAPGWLSALLSEALAYENARRAFEADPLRPPLVYAPAVKSLDDEIPFDDEICRTALVYGLAAQLFLDDEADFRSQDFRGRYIAALRESLRAREEAVEQVY